MLLASARTWAVCGGYAGKKEEGMEGKARVHSQQMSEFIR